MSFSSYNLVVGIYMSSNFDMVFSDGQVTLCNNLADKF